MDYKYEFERLLFTTKQALSAIDLEKKKILSLAELVILHNAVEYYKMGSSLRLTLAQENGVTH